jgi:hypothetical protein
VAEMKIHFVERLETKEMLLNCVTCLQPLEIAVFIDGKPYGKDCAIKKLAWKATPEQAKTRLSMMKISQGNFFKAIKNKEDPRDIRAAAIAVI